MEKIREKGHFKGLLSEIPALLPQLLATTEKGDREGGQREKKVFPNAV